MLVPFSPFLRLSGVEIRRGNGECQEGIFAVDLATEKLIEVIDEKALCWVGLPALFSFSACSEDPDGAGASVRETG
jgi:hypothetical protein